MVDIVGYFPATLAIDSATGTRLRNAEAQVYAMTDTAFATPLAITDMADVPFTGNTLSSNSDGIYPEFKPPVGVMQVIVKSGQALTPMTSIAVQASAAVDAATEATEARDQAVSAFERTQDLLSDVVTLAAAAKNPDLLVTGTVTRDSNQAVTSANVVWPDGTPGTFTALVLSTAFPGAVDSYRITYGSPVQKTFTQPTITRNTAGAATAVPQIVVS